MRERHSGYLAPLASRGRRGARSCRNSRVREVRHTAASRALSDGLLIGVGQLAGGQKCCTGRISTTG